MGSKGLRDRRRLQLLQDARLRAQRPLRWCGTWTARLQDKPCWGHTGRHQHRFAADHAYGHQASFLYLKTNHAGGTLGVISTGLPLIMRMGIKPASSISRDQETCTFDGDKHILQVQGRHDPCVLPRCPPLVEGMGALAVADACMRQRASQGSQLHTLNGHSEERPAKVARISSA